MPVYIKKVSPADPRFTGRKIEIVARGYQSVIPIPDTVVLCNGCNENLHSEDGQHEAGYLVYLGKSELNRDLPYDFYCESCVRKYFPKAKEVK